MAIEYTGRLTGKTTVMMLVQSEGLLAGVGSSSLAVTALALLLVLSVLGNSCGAPQRLFERRNWTPQAMLYLKGAQGRRFISDQSRRKELADRPPPERRNPNLQLLTLPEAVALLLASLQKPQEDEGGNFDQSEFLEDRLLNW
ncbi:spexin [Cricetulus griseus]|uniref:spexin n=1 Tax=Cricetulus griseus TaxID=10029 RepID=UPI00022F4A9F|nr:spexin [Cricetulus griseus]